MLCCLSDNFFRLLAAFLGKRAVFGHKGVVMMTTPSPQVFVPHEYPRAKTASNLGTEHAPKVRQVQAKHPKSVVFVQLSLLLHKYNTFRRDRLVQQNEAGSLAAAGDVAFFKV